MKLKMFIMATLAFALVSQAWCNDDDDDDVKMSRNQEKGTVQQFQDDTTRSTHKADDLEQIKKDAQQQSDDANDKKFIIRKRSAVMGDRG